MINVRALCVGFGVFMLSACAGAGDFFRGYAKGESAAMQRYNREALSDAEWGAVAFALGDFGALDTDAMETHATPWKLAAAVLTLQENAASGAPLSQDTLRRVMTRFGFLYPQTIANWPARIAPPRRPGDPPLGLSVGEVRREIPRVSISAANLGCASCHSGVSYDARGAPDIGVAWLGAPNTSLDLEAYVQAIYAGFKTYAPSRNKLLEAVKTLFPETSAVEMKSLERFVWPRLEKRMQILAAQGDRPLPFVNGAPGLTNGVAALKMQFGLLAGDAHNTQRGFTAVPDLADRGFRTSLLYDGAYFAPGVEDRVIDRGAITEAHLDGLADVTAFFTVPSMGVSPEKAIAQRTPARAALRYLASYRPQRFPGNIDAGAAARGRDLYQRACASCHGAYDASLSAPKLLTFPNGLYDVGTDATRRNMFDSETAQSVNRSRYRDAVQARATGKYAAQILSGLWMSAPYLHNGAIPSLRAFFFPEERPARFLIGGHKLDFESVGIAHQRAANGDWVYPAGYTPWSRPHMLDTRAVGFSNKGHEAEIAGLNATQKTDLIEYLKLL
jgi:hypothetical protein